MEENRDSSNKNNGAGFRLPTRIVFCTAAVGFGVVSALNPMGAAGLPLSIIAAAMLTALALSYGPDNTKVTMLFSLGLVSYAISVFIFALLGQYPTNLSLILSAAALFPSILALPVYLTLRMKKGRAVSIAAAALSSMCLWLIYTALSIYAEYGACTIENIRLMLDQAFEPVRQMLESLTYDKNGETTALYNITDIEQIIYNIEIILLGTTAAVMTIVAYFTTLAVRLIVNCFDQQRLLPVGYRIRMRRVDGEDGPTVELSRETVQWRIELDSVTAVIFIVAYIVSVLFSSADKLLLPAVAAQNLIIMLTPAFIYAGGRDILLGFGSNSAGRGCALPVFALILIFLNPMTLFMLLSVIGVAATLKENHRRSSINKSGKE